MFPLRWSKVLIVFGVVNVMALPHQPSPSYPPYSVTYVRQRRQVTETISIKDLPCLLLRSEGNNDKNCPFAESSSSSTQSPVIASSPQSPPSLPATEPDAGPALACSCVPHWQCNDERSSQIVEGGSVTSFALDLRFNLGCNAPEHVCCVDVDLNATAPVVQFVPSSCGQRNPEGVGTTFLGFQDQQSQFGEFPWTVAIITSSGFGSSLKPLYIGGGSLIHKQVVLTVAHNMLNYTADKLIVRLGEWNLATQSEAEPHQEREVRQIMYHPEYHNVKQHYDVALLVLDKPVELSATINTICLPSASQDYQRDNCVVSGWGKKDFDKNNSYQKVMKKVTLPLVNHDQCQTALQATRLGSAFNLHDSFLCAGGLQEGQDPCTGDGGSPLACQMQSDPSRYIQVGVVAWGIGCGRLGVPGVYADVAKALPWIDQVIGGKKLHLRTAL